ncbi:hypothetical protein ES703_79367 [subsurface metagenome]
MFFGFTKFIGSHQLIETDFHKFGNVETRNLTCTFVRIDWVTTIRYNKDTVLSVFSQSPEVAFCLSN